MSPAKFQPLAHSDDHRTAEMAQITQIPMNDDDDTTSDREKPPTRWKSVKAAYTPKVTYVAAPSNDSTFDEKNTRPTKHNRRSTSRLSILANPVTNFRIPTFAAPWQHESNSSTSTTVRTFDRRKQWRRLFVNGFIQWLLTLSIVLAQWGILFGFSRQPTLSKYQKYTFNAMTTLLSLALGLAIVAALKSYSKLLSWRFLASKYRDLQDFELVMNCDSQAKVLKLLWASRTTGRFWLNKTQLLCIVSLVVFIALQITIGLLGLTYSMDNSTVPRWEYGNVSIVDLSNIYQDPTYNTDNFADQTGAANYFGLVGQNYNFEIEVPGNGKDGFEWVYSSDNQSFFYNFVDSGADVGKGEAKVIGSTKRWIDSHATCVQLEIISGGYIDADAIVRPLNYTDENGLFRSIVVEGKTTFTTTYMSNSSNATTCGPRCASLLILDSAGTTDEMDLEAPQLWACNNTVSQVHNSNLCAKESDCTLSDNLAKILAGAIGYSGTFYTNNPLQFKTYPPGSPYSWDGTTDSAFQTAEYRAAQVSLFATSALAAMDDSGPRLIVAGMSPQAGVTLNVEWQFSIPVLCIVPAVQLFVLLIVCVWANGALIKDGSYLATARLLRPIVDKLEEHGCALTGDEIARELGNIKIIYGVRAASGSSNSTPYTSTNVSQADWHVGIISESEGYGNKAEEGWRPAAMFPAGRYDGTGSSDDSQLTRADVSSSCSSQKASFDDSERSSDEEAGLLN